MEGRAQGGIVYRVHEYGDRRLPAEGPGHSQRPHTPPGIGPRIGCCSCSLGCPAVAPARWWWVVHGWMEHPHNAKPTTLSRLWVTLQTSGHSHTRTDNRDDPRPAPQAPATHQQQASQQHGTKRCVFSIPLCSWGGGVRANHRVAILLRRRRRRSSSSSFWLVCFCRSCR